MLRSAYLLTLKKNGNNGNNVEATLDTVAFDNVASTLLLVWTGLYSLGKSLLISQLTSVSRGHSTTRHDAGDSGYRLTASSAPPAGTIDGGL